MTVLYTPWQERIIERLKEQRDRDDREKTEELDCNKKELKELKERLSLLQGDLSDREVRNSPRNRDHQPSSWSPCMLCCGNGESRLKSATWSGQLSHPKIFRSPIVFFFMCSLLTFASYIFPPPPSPDLFPSSDLSAGPERARIISGLLRPEEGLQTQESGDHFRAKEGGMPQAGKPP